MEMTQLQKLGIWVAIAGDLAAVVVLAIAIPSYLANRDAMVKMETTIALLDKRMEDRKADTEKQVQAVEDRRQAVKTPQQAATAIEQSVPGVKIILAQPVETTTANVTNTLPDAPSASISQESLFALNDKLAACEKDGIRLKSCEADKVDLAAQRDAAVTAVKGSFWKRALNCGVRVGIGASAGAFGGKTGAIAGAGMGVGSCFLVKP